MIGRKKYICQQESKTFHKIEVIQGGSNMTGTDYTLFTHKSVPVIFEPPVIKSMLTKIPPLLWYLLQETDQI